VGRGDAVFLCGVAGVDETFVDLVALGVDDARARLVAGFEADFVGERGDFVFVEDAAVFVAGFYAFFFGDDGEVACGRDGGVLRGRGDGGVAFGFLLVQGLLRLVGHGCGRWRRGG
jgi:hypothetical protein